MATDTIEDDVPEGTGENRIYVARIRIDLGVRPDPYIVVVEEAVVVKTDDEALDSAEAGGIADAKVRSKLSAADIRFRSMAILAVVEVED